MPGRLEVTDKAVSEGPPGRDRPTHQAAHRRAKAVRADDQRSRERTGVGLDLDPRGGRCETGDPAAPFENQVRLCPGAFGQEDVEAGPPDSVALARQPGSGAESSEDTGASGQAVADSRDARKPLPAEVDAELAEDLDATGHEAFSAGLVARIVALLEDQHTHAAPGQEDSQDQPNRPTSDDHDICVLAPDHSVQP